MRGSSDWLPVFWLLVGILAITKAIDALRPWLRRRLQRRSRWNDSLEEQGWTRHSHSEN